MRGSRATAIDETVRDEALEWLVEFDAGGVSPEESARFIRWLNASPHHREAFEDLQREWRRIDVVRQLDTGKVDSDVAGKWLRRQYDRRGIVPVAIAATVAAVSFGFWLAQVPSVHEAEYVTNVGEQRVVALHDESLITLNTDTKVEVRYTRDERRVRLLRGEAHFEVASAADCPFIVAAGTGAVRAVGTAFAVRMRGVAVEVTVTEGTVEVLPPDKPADRKALRTTPDRVSTTPRMLTERHKLRYGNDVVEVMSAVTTDEIKRELAWRDGMLDFESTPLSDVIAEAGRYTRNKLIIVDPELEALEFTGYFRAGDVALLMTLLESNSIIDARRVDENTVHIAKSVHPR
jgi:transmembrane sensor